MLFHKKVPVSPRVRVSADHTLLYEGELKALPIKESIIIEKSILYFDDPEPCYIHRNAVNMRISEELYRELLVTKGSHAGPLLLAWADFEKITDATLI